MDISADLTELGRTPVVVVCAGAKSVRLGGGAKNGHLLCAGAFQHALVLTDLS